jgi:outer membrane protein OmpA-like peptidoglycan-associated protein
MTIAKTKVFQWAVIFPVIFCANGQVAKADCTDLLNQFNAAIANRSLPDAKAVEAKIAVDAGCGDRLNEIRRQRAVLELGLVQQMIDKKAPTSEYEGLLLDASDMLWRAASALGDIKFSERKFAEATVAYERAIETMKNIGLTPTAPDEKSVKAIFDRAVKSRSLAANEEGTGEATFVSVAKDHRDGTIGGMMSPVVRDIKINSVAMPIQFETATAKFSPVGEKAAKEFLEALRQQNPPQLTLIGHTDERGAADYNMRLSGERVKAVADYLKQNGITAKVNTIAKGKSEPLQLSDVPDLKQEDIWALDRRVVWRRN